MKTVSSTEIGGFRYINSEVLHEAEDRINRKIDLDSAMAVTNTEHEEIGVIVKLESGEEVEILSSLIAVEGEHIEVKGGHLIPIAAILRVEI
jgi:hypothetical protein